MDSDSTTTTTISSSSTSSSCSKTPTATAAATPAAAAGTTTAAAAAVAASLLLLLLLLSLLSLLILVFLLLAVLLILLLHHHHHHHHHQHQHHHHYHHQHHHHYHRDDGELRDNRPWGILSKHPTLRYKQSNTLQTESATLKGITEGHRSRKTVRIKQADFGRLASSGCSKRPESLDPRLCSAVYVHFAGSVTGCRLESFVHTGL